MDVDKFAFGARRGGTPPHRLDPAKLIETAKRLSDDINARLPGSTLANLGLELSRLTVATVERGKSASKPLIAVRVISALLIVTGMSAVGLLVSHVRATWPVNTVGDLFNAIEASSHMVILSAGAVWTCLTLESRIKRREVLGYIEELREFIHVIDATQLYYTPAIYHSQFGNGTTHVMIDETYLLDCTLMLGVIGNLASLYARGAIGDSILRAASEVEMLAIAIATKQLSKAEAVRLIAKVSVPPAGDDGR